MTTRRPVDELDLIQDRSADALAAGLARAARAELEGDAAELLRAQEALADQLARVSAVADLFGRRRLLLEANASAGRRVFARVVPFLPAIPFQEAVDAILKRYPVLVAGWEDAQEAYGDGAFAVARAATARATTRIQKIIGDAVQTGTPRDDVVGGILRALSLGAKIDPEDEFAQRARGFTRAYADTVFRTNTTSAYAAGRHQQAQDPNVRKVICAWRYTAVGDADTRDNHQASDGLIAHLDDPIWGLLSPPQGFQCRCTLEMVTSREARRLGVCGPEGELLRFAARPSGAGPDPGFRVAGRPDRAIYG